MKFIRSAVEDREDGRLRRRRTRKITRPGPRVIVVPAIPVVYLDRKNNYCSISRNASVL
jgi:hypothetical protein